MTPNPKVALQSTRISSGLTALVVGGTTGIGSAVARKLAAIGCSRVIILGRDEKRAGDVLDRMRDTATKGFEGSFIKGDISYVRGIKAALESLKSLLGNDKLDYVVMCQNGPPTGTVNINEDGEGKEFTIQAISRFLLTHLIINNELLNPNAKKVAENGRSKPLLTIDQSRRDSTVLDSVILEFNARYPQYTFYHLHPGLVKTELFDIHLFPFPLSYIAGLGLLMMGSTPDEYANIPVYILVHPDARKELGEGKFWDHRIKVKNPSVWPSARENREKLWNKLLAMTEEK
ncbi:uncharacterized protein I206_107323 [Kwoniella pini CBS 10737]|uniref:NAD(P)-binding protein n=1 Tax=Kwoniella pini CBS 10737 TaxID=1296096 RepID=A0A1B9HYL4_9TREE|nr:uncharacterized protein I206_05133 [Kwoniella pini CBS 10737]OCF48356.1 hypothetical protein I206_05133 [Kwoniella pini CBS 10737]